MRLWACLLACTVLTSAASSAAPTPGSESPMALIHTTVLDRVGRTRTSLPAPRLEMHFEFALAALQRFRDSGWPGDEFCVLPFTDATDTLPREFRMAAKGLDDVGENAGRTPGDQQRLEGLAELTGGRILRLRRVSDDSDRHVSIRPRQETDSDNLRVYWRRGYRAPTT